MAFEDGFFVLECKYCYCPAIMRKSLDAWSDNPQPRKDILKQIEREAANLADDPRETTNLYLVHPEIVEELRTQLHADRDGGRSAPNRG